MFSFFHESLQREMDGLSILQCVCVSRVQYQLFWVHGRKTFAGNRLLVYERDFNGIGTRQESKERWDGEMCVLKWSLLLLLHTVIIIVLSLFFSWMNWTDSILFYSILSPTTHGMRDERDTWICLILPDCYWLKWEEEYTWIVHSFFLVLITTFSSQELEEEILSRKGLTDLTFSVN